MVLTLKAQISATTVDRFAISILDFGGTIRLDISCELSADNPHDISSLIGILSICNEVWKCLC